MDQTEAVAVEAERELKEVKEGGGTAAPTRGTAAAPPEPLIDVSLDLGSSEMSASFEIAWQDEQELGEVELQANAAALAGVNADEEVDLLYDE